MAARWWMVLKLDDGSVEDGKGKLFGSADDAQKHVAALIDSGVPSGRIQVFNADTHPFSVTHKTIVSFEPEAKTEVKGTHVSEKAAPKEVAGVQNGVRLSSVFRPALILPRR